MKLIQLILGLMSTVVIHGYTIKGHQPTEKTNKKNEEEKENNSHEKQYSNILIKQNEDLVVQLLEILKKYKKSKEDSTLSTRITKTNINSQSSEHNDDNIESNEIVKKCFGFGWRNCPGKREAQINRVKTASRPVKSYEDPSRKNMLCKLRRFLQLAKIYMELNSLWNIKAPDEARRDIF
ncbi:uncharacterized protein [Clytia hemisphaerica]